MTFKILIHLRGIVMNPGLFHAYNGQDGNLVIKDYFFQKFILQLESSVP
jgi:hypothetical protein